MQKHAADQSVQIRALVQHIEAIRQKRRTEIEQGLRSPVRRYSQAELSEQVFPSYKNLLLSLTQRLPSRASILEIAAYLDCSLEETNHLLSAAEYVPLVEVPAGTQLEFSLARAAELAYALPFPAFTFAPGGHATATNRSFAEWTGISEISTIPHYLRNGIGLIFDTNIGRHLFDFELAFWDQNRVTTINALWNFSRAFRDEGWFRRFVHQLFGLPDFKVTWMQQVETHAPAPSDLWLMMRHAGSGAPHQVRVISMEPTGFALPLIIGFVPVADVQQESR